MATLTLQQAWLSLASDPAQVLRLKWSADRSFVPDVPTDVRRYAGGRARAVTRAGRIRTVTIPARVLPAELDQLETWRGSTLLYRDGLGSRWWCVITAMPWKPTDNASRRDVQLQLTEVTYAEGV